MSKSVRLFRGLPVVDATKPHIVKVEHRDLVGGWTTQPNYCVVHHALQREYHIKREEVHVHSTKVYIISEDKTHWLRYEPSTALKIEIIVHDRGGEFKAGDYRLNVVSKSARLDALRASGQGRSARAKSTATTKRAPLHHVSTRAKANYSIKE